MGGAWAMNLDRLDKFPERYPFTNRFGYTFTEAHINQLVKHGYSYIMRKGRTLEGFNYHLAISLLKLINDFNPEFMVTPTNLVFMFLKYKMKKCTIHGDRKPLKCKLCTLNTICRKCSIRLQVVSLSDLENVSEPVRDREFTFDEIMYKDFIHHINKNLGKMYVEVFTLRYMDRTFSEIAAIFSERSGSSKASAEKIAQRAMIRVQDEWERYTE